MTYKRRNNFQIEKAVGKLLNDELDRISRAFEDISEFDKLLILTLLTSRNITLSGTLNGTGNIIDHQLVGRFNIKRYQGQTVDLLRILSEANVVLFKVDKDGNATFAGLTLSGHLLFSPDNTYDIGAAGATRPRALYVAGAGTFGGLVTGDEFQVGAVRFSQGFLSVRGRIRPTSNAAGLLELVPNTGTGSEIDFYHLDRVSDGVNYAGYSIVTDATTGLTFSRFTAGSGSVPQLFTFTGSLTVTSDVAVNGANLTTDDATFNIINTTATTVNAFGAATTISIGAGTGTTTVNNDLAVGDQISSINAIATEGNFGVGAIVDVVSQTNLSSSLSASNMSNTNAAGLYELRAYLTPNTTEALDSVTLTFDWDNATKSSASSSLTLNPGSAFVTHSIFVRHSAASASSIRYSTTYVNGGGAVGSYDLYLIAKRLD